MARVAEIERSIAFYELLGFRANHVLRNDDGQAFWADLEAGKARLMLTRADEPVTASHQGVLFYFYSDNLVELRSHLLQNGVTVSEISHPFFMPKGEMRVDDPDGYCAFIGQSD